MPRHMEAEHDEWTEKKRPTAQSVLVLVRNPGIREPDAVGR